MSDTDTATSPPSSAPAHPPQNRYIVRYGSTRILGEFASRGDRFYRRNDEVIVRSERGVEYGVVLADATEKTAEWLGEQRPQGKLLRHVSDEDRRSIEEAAVREREFFAECQTMIAAARLQMTLVDAEQVFGGERIIFYYLAEKRVDFRDLVKALAKEFRKRIEMRHIGVRDEARLLADYGDCGKPVCCNTHLREMPPVSMKMAKLQKATLDPNKISGRCGRLKCCLRYEYDTYREHRKELPSVGTTVVTAAGQGRVLAQELLAKKLLVAFEDGRRVLVDQSEVVTVVSRNDGKGHDKGGNASHSEPETK